MRTAARRLLLVLAAIFVLSLIGTAVGLLSARADVQQARDTLDGLADAGADRDTLTTSLASVQSDLDDAASALNRPGPRVIGALPLLGRTPHAVRVSAEVAAQVLRDGRQVLDDVPDPLLSEGRIDLSGLSSVQRSTAEAAQAASTGVERLKGTATGWTPQVVQDGTAELLGRLVEARDALARADSGLQALDGVLGDGAERHLLLALQNNAELRGTGGVVTVFAEATTRDGQLELGSFRDVEDVADPPDRVTAVPVPEDYGRLYGSFKAGTTLWKNVNMSPDAPTSSTVLARVAAQSLRPPPDVVLWFDVPLIAALLRGVGPVQLPDGSTLDGDNAVRRLLSEAYANATDTAEGQAARRAELRAAADAVLSRLLSKDEAAGGSSTQVLRQLVDAVTGRHLMVWSADPDEQDQLMRAGLAGSVRADGGDLSTLTVHNLGGGDTDGNKLDYYGRRQTTVDVTVGPDDAVIEQELALRNTAPPGGLPVYVAGRVTPGVSNSFVTLSLPADAQDVSLTRDGVSLAVAVLPEADHGVLTDVVGLAPGQTITWKLRYRLPLQDGAYRLTLVPQPLAVDGGVSVTIRSDSDRDLFDEAGLALPDDGLVVSGAFDAVTEVSAGPERRGRLGRLRDAVRNFWSEPVRLP